MKSIIAYKQTAILLNELCPKGITIDEFANELLMAELTTIKRDMK